MTLCIVSLTLGKCGGALDLYPARPCAHDRRIAGTESGTDRECRQLDPRAGRLPADRRAGFVLVDLAGLRRSGLRIFGPLAETALDRQAPHLVEMERSHRCLSLAV